MKTRINSIAALLIIFLIYILFLFIGIFLAYWIGMGWFFFFHTISILIASLPQIYWRIIKPLLHIDYMEQIKGRELMQNKKWFYPTPIIILNIINVTITVLAFWKINIPLRVVLQAIAH